MKIPHMSKTAKIVVVVVVLVLLGALAFLLIQRRLPGSVITEREVEVAPPPPQVTPEEKLMGKVEVEMGKVFDSWLESEGVSYTFEDQLKGLWMARYGTTPKYRPKGINELVKNIRKNEFFAKCKPPHIEFGSFVEGGAIQKVQDLHNFLSVCEPQG